VERFVSLAGGRTIAQVAGDQIALWSAAGRRLSQPIGLKNYKLGAAAACQAPRRLSGLAVSTRGDAIAIADERSAVWLVHPDDRRVTRVAVAAVARSVTALPDGSGFAVGLADGRVLRLSRDGALRGSPVKVFELGGVRRIVVAPDGESFIAVDDDETTARNLAWEGRA
jgi:hypothetical protein